MKNDWLFFSASSHLLNGLWRIVVGGWLSWYQVVDKDKDVSALMPLILSIFIACCPAIHPYDDKAS